MALSARLWRLLPLLRGAEQSVCQLARTWGSRGRCGTWGFRGSEVTRCPGPVLTFGRASGVPRSPGLEVGHPGQRIVELRLCKPLRRPCDRGVRPLCPSCPRVEQEGERTLAVEKAASSKATDRIWTQVVTSDSSVR